MGPPWNRILRVEEIDEALVSEFSCGDSSMDEWFLGKAINWCYLGFCQVYVALDARGVVGFFALSPTQIEPVSLSRRMRAGKNRMGQPGILLGRIAVRRDLQRSAGHVGSLLLEHAIYQACKVSDLIGGRFIVLDAKSNDLCRWYSRMGFRALKNCELRMVLPMKDAKQMIASLGERHFRF